MKRAPGFVGTWAAARGNSSTTPAVFPQSEQRNFAFDFRRNHRNPMIPGDIAAPPCLL